MTSIGERECTQILNRLLCRRCLQVTLRSGAGDGTRDEFPFDVLGLQCAVSFFFFFYERKKKNRQEGICALNICVAAGNSRCI